MDKTIYDVETEFGPIRIVITSPNEHQGGPASIEDVVRRKITESLDKGVDMAVLATRVVLKSVENIGIDEVSVETGLTIEAGLWGLAKGEAALSITMTWKKP